MEENAKDFSVLIGIELDKESINSLKQQISGIKTNPIKIKIDTSDVTSQINKIKQAIQSLGQVKINPLSVSGNMSGSGSIDSYTNNLQKSYRSLYSLSKQISSMELKVGKLNMSGVNKNEISGYISELERLKQTYATLKSQLNSGANVNFASFTSSIEQAKTKIAELSAKVDNAKVKLASDIKLKIDNGSLENQLTAVESKFKKLGVESSEVSSQIQKLKSLLGNMDASDDIESVISDYRNFQQTLKTTENQVRGLQRAQSEQTNIVNKTSSAFGNLAKQAAAYFSAFQMINYSIRALKEAYQNVKDIDTAFTELKKVTDETNASYEKFLSNAADNAKEIGTTIDDYITSTADFARLGYNFDQSQNLAKVANIYNVVGDEIGNVNDATQNIISTMKAFGIEVDDSISIVDKFNQVGKIIAQHHSNMMLEDGYIG